MTHYPGLISAPVAPADPRLNPLLGVGLYDPAKPIPARLVSAFPTAAQAALVSNAGSRERQSEQAQQKQARRLDAAAMKDAAAKLLYHSDDEKLAALGKRVSHCCLVPHGQSAVALRKTDKGAYLTGLKRCSSVWCCSICSARISAGRRDELNAILQGAREAGLAPVMIALTSRHSRRDALPDLLDGMKKAKHRLTQLKTWRELRPVLRGTVTATEITFGNNGFHVHYHVLLLLALPAGEALAAVERQRDAWTTALHSAGLTGNQAAFRADPATKAGDYFGKWGAACELALARSKTGKRAGSRSPWDLLADAAQGDQQAGRLWLEYARAFRGRRQLVFSKGLRALFGLDEVADEDLPDPAAEPAAEVLRVWTHEGFAGWSRWRLARRRSVALLTAAETGGDLDRAEFGPTDRARWLAENPGLLVESEE